ncbi:Gfo/Idh/MocA family oxidoreductase [Rhodoferax sp.]|uniref:Gfo/Idh/MocA family protein n=1 Tax=Rhodoferax sp. TaxID=50421 RepID=UPI002604E662|nr:Gfo/Idh/MocA family oxidoreductase [Rhodoferax sp.]MDD2927085.1 Gfo/Idh/MocA family oxidoreductase [Rhodoferax sp.]
MSQLATPKLRLAVVGAGAMGQVHMDVVRRCPGCTLSAIVDPLPAAAGLAAQIGVPLYPTIDALLAQDRPDGLILATPNALHVPQARQCMAAGVPILLEKPIATTVAEGEQLVQEVEQRKASVLIGHHRAHSPIMAKARAVIDSGQLGRLVAVMGSATFYKPDAYYAEAPWRSAIGGGPILLNLIHEVHNLRMLCGDIVAVQAFASQAVRGFPVEDTVAINLRFASGVLGTFLLSDTAACPRSWEQTSQENKAYAHEPDEDCYVITGTNGALSIPTMRLKTYPRPEDRSWWKAFETRVVDLVRDDPLKHQLEHFCAVIRHQAAPLVSARDGLQNLRVTQAVAEAARTGRVIDIPSH